MDFAGVEEWHFDRQPRNAGPWIIIFEARWAEIEDLVYVDFDGVGVDPADPTLEDIRASDAFVAARPVQITLCPMAG